MRTWGEDSRLHAEERPRGSRPLPCPDLGLLVSRRGQHIPRVWAAQPPVLVTAALANSHGLLPQ